MWLVLVIVSVRFDLELGVWRRVRRSHAFMHRCVVATSRRCSHRLRAMAELAWGCAAVALRLRCVRLGGDCVW